MGQTNSAPVTTKRTNLWQNDTYSVGASCMQGWRIHMEDAHTCYLQLPGDPQCAYFSVFDGHGGNRVAKHAGRHLHEHLISQPEYGRRDIKGAIRQAFLSLDAEMQKELKANVPDQCAPINPLVLNKQSPEDKIYGSSHLNLKQRKATGDMHARTGSLGDELAGSTGIIILIKDQMLYCGNVGDSRAVCCSLGIANSLSTDHKPTLRKEKERIMAAGGWVDANRVNGNLALSRAFGDFVFKRNSEKPPEKQIVSASPDVHVRRISPEEDEFVIIGCDGVWDVMTNQEVVSFVRLRLGRGFSPDKICEELMMRCLAPNCQTNGLGCDNMTVVLVCFLNGQPFSELQRRCSRPCKGGPAIDILGV